MLQERGIRLTKASLSKGLSGDKGISIERLLDIRQALREEAQEKDSSKVARSIMHRPVETADAEEQIRSVLERMAASGYSQMPVLDGDKVLGVIRADEIIGKLSEISPKDPARRFCSGVVKVPDDAPITTVRPWVKQYGYVLVEKEGAIVGIITYADFL